ncbi:copper chaperone [Pseudomonas wadenswilerensis]
MRLGQSTQAWLHSPWPWLATASLAGWATLLAAPSQSALPAFCGSMADLLAVLGWSGLTQALVLDPLGLWQSWLLMLLAMMPLLLVEPMLTLWQRSLPRRRALAIVAFVVGYVAIWSVAGIALTLLSIGLKLLAGDSLWLAATLSVLVALLWQSTPLKQTALNRCHGAPRISAFGWQVIRDCLGYGAGNGAWCILSCWPAMLLPMLVQQGHLLVMLLCMAWLVYERERMAQAMRMRMALEARWRWPLPQRLAVAGAPRATKYLSSRCKSLASRVPAR